MQSRQSTPRSGQTWPEPALPRPVPPPAGQGGGHGRTPGRMSPGPAPGTGGNGPGRPPGAPEPLIRVGDDFEDEYPGASALATECYASHPEVARTSHHALMTTSMNAAVRRCHGIPGARLVTTMAQIHSVPTSSSPARTARPLSPGTPDDRRTIRQTCRCATGATRQTTTPASCKCWMSWPSHNAPASPTTSGQSARAIRGRKDAPRMPARPPPQLSQAESEHAREEAQNDPSGRAGGQPSPTTNPPITDLGRESSISADHGTWPSAIRLRRRTLPDTGCPAMVTSPWPAAQTGQLSCRAQLGGWVGRGPGKVAALAAV